jgi:hypothetical protein
MRRCAYETEGEWMADFTMTLGNFEALPEKGTDNFATGIYELGYDGADRSMQSKWPIS